MRNPAKTKASIADALGSRPGTPSTTISAPTPAPEPEGLILSEVLYKPLDFFRLNPENEIFRKLKTEQDYADLERAIRETGSIEALQAMPDGLLLKGESRLIVAQRMGLDRLPVRLVLSPLTAEEQRKILWLDNLARVEIDEDTRLWMYAQLWPGYYRGDTVSPPTTKAQVATAIGQSERQVQRDAGIVREASAQAAAEGREPTVDDLKSARERKNAARREKKPAPEKTCTTDAETVILKVRRVAERLRREAAEEVDRSGPNAQVLSYAADLIEEALR